MRASGKRRSGAGPNGSSTLSGRYSSISPGATSVISSAPPRGAARSASSVSTAATPPPAITTRVAVWASAMAVMLAPVGRLVGTAATMGG